MLLAAIPVQGPEKYTSIQEKYTSSLVIHWEWVPEGEGCPFTTPFLVFSSEFITSL